MRKFITHLTVAAALFAPIAFAAPADIQPNIVIANSDGDYSYPALYTESSWMTLRVPISALGGVTPTLSTLTLTADKLPSGTTITLTGVAQDGADALLTVEVARDNLNSYVNAISTITLSSNGQTLTSFSVPVVGTAYAGAASTSGL